MKEYNEQVVETLDDAGCIIANKNIIIDNLQARIAELEAENERLKDSHFNRLGIESEKRMKLREQLAASQLRETQLLEALEKLATIANQYAGHYPYQVATVVDAALSIPTDTSALDAYVAEKVKEAWPIVSSYPDQNTELRRQLTELTRQRDLAVEALEDVRKELQQSNDRLNEEREIWDRVMGDGVKKLERLELELDDCLYVLESLWDKTCNKEVTEKWAGILIRNKRGIGASSAEDSSEQTTA